MVIFGKKKLAKKDARIAELEQELKVLKHSVDALNRENKELTTQNANLGRNNEELTKSLTQSEETLKSILSKEEAQKKIQRKIIYYEKAIESLIKEVIIRVISLTKKLKPALSHEDTKVMIDDEKMFLIRGFDTNQSNAIITKRYTEYPNHGLTSEILKKVKIRQRIIRIKEILYILQSMLRIAEELQVFIKKEIKFSANSELAIKWFEENIGKELHVMEEYEKVIQNPYREELKIGKQSYRLQVYRYKEILKALRKEEVDEMDISEANNNFIQILGKLLQACNTLNYTFSDKDPYRLFIFFLN